MNGLQILEFWELKLQHLTVVELEKHRSTNFILCFKGMPMLVFFSIWHLNLFGIITRKQQYGIVKLWGFCICSTVEQLTSSHPCHKRKEWLGTIWNLIIRVETESGLNYPETKILKLNILCEVWWHLQNWGQLLNLDIPKLFSLQCLNRVVVDVSKLKFLFY